MQSGFLSERDGLRANWLLTLRLWKEFEEDFPRRRAAVLKRTAQKMFGFCNVQNIIPSSLPGRRTHQHRRTTPLIAVRPLISRHSHHTRSPGASPSAFRPDSVRPHTASDRSITAAVSLRQPGQLRPFAGTKPLQSAIQPHTHTSPFHN